MKSNERVGTTIGTIILVIIAVTAFSFVLVYEKGKYENSNDSTEQTGMVAVPPTNVPTNENLVVDEPIEEWKIYRDEEYDFEFKHPSNYVVKKTNENYLIGEVSMGKFIHLSVKKWKDYTVPEGTPGTFWEKISQNRWKYFSNNFEKITSGNCNNDELGYVPGPTAADPPKICMIDKQKKYIKIETENKIIYFTNDLEIQWGITSENKNLLDKITATVVVK
ncbi:MAG: hypothetical protein KBC83_04735 [Candidatus Moranbacteria bacterium]|jgi:hypothetical protein|nr:hypothetical protein [Candidatus Moranbacteria bacterium]MBP9801936.1 hypothetical protein [Candidatus Moranbacteria bacterium]